MPVRRLLAHACLCDFGGELHPTEEFARTGDAEAPGWAERLDRGETALVDMRVAAELDAGDGSTESVQAEIRRIWIHRLQDPPQLEALIAELAGRDFDDLAARIADRGEPLSRRDLDEMYVTVELADDLLRSLRARRAGAAKLADRGTDADTERQHA